MGENTIITLEDQKSYLIVDEITLNDVDYYYLCSTTKPLEIKIAASKNQTIYFIEDKDVLIDVYDAFVYHMKEKLGIKEEREG